MLSILLKRFSQLFQLLQLQQLQLSQLRPKTLWLLFKTPIDQFQNVQYIEGKLEPEGVYMGPCTEIKIFFEYIIDYMTITNFISLTNVSIFAVLLISFLILLL